MDEAWYVLNKAAERLRETVEAVLLPLGLRRRHYVALTELLEGEPSQQELSDRIPVDRATMVKIVDELETWKLVKRRQDPLDRRAYQVVLLPKGAALVQTAAANIAAAEKKLLRDLTPSERKTLVALSQKLLGWENGAYLQRGPVRARPARKTPARGARAARSPARAETVPAPEDEI